MAHARGRLAASAHAARSLVRRFTADASGATAIEYTLLIMLIAIVIIGALTIIGSDVNTMIVSAASGLH
jgi:pilus assembly protein Flp/PilA